MHWQYVFKKLEKGRFIAFIFLNTIQYPRTLKNNIHCFIWIPVLQLATAMVHSVGKTHVLDVTVDLIWLLFFNILSFNFVTTPRKPLRFTRFIRSYVNRPAVVLTNHCQSYTAFLLDVRCSKLPCSIFLQHFVPDDSAFALLSTPVAQILWTQGGSGDEQMWNSYKYINFNSWS